MGLWRLARFSEERTLTIILALARNRLMAVEKGKLTKQEPLDFPKTGCSKSGPLDFPITCCRKGGPLDFPNSSSSKQRQVQANKRKVKKQQR